MVPFSHISVGNEQKQQKMVGSRCGQTISLLVLCAVIIVGRGRGMILLGQHK